jgi:DNA-binding LytR/AlgR family response regulator
MEPKRKIIYFNSRDELLRVDLSSVVYFEADGNYTRFVSMNGQADMVCMNLGRMEELLAIRFKDAPGSFARIGKRFIINMRYVYRVNTLKQELTLSDQTTFTQTLSISKIALKGLKDLMSPHVLPEKQQEK